MQVFRSQRAVERSLLTLGIGLVAAAIVGGGLEVAGFEVPLVSSVIRQILLAVLGIAVAGLALWVKPSEAPEKPAEVRAPEKPAEVRAPDVTRTRSRGLVAAMPSEVVVEQPTEVWAQVCLPRSPGFVEALPQYTSSGEEIGKADAKRFPGSVQFTDREGRLMNALLSVTVTSQDFHVVNEKQTISLSPSHDSGVLVFEVVPSRVTARARVFVSVTQQQDGASVTVVVASVMTRVKPSDDAASFPGRWNVTRQDAGTAVGLGILQGRRVEPPGEGEPIFKPVESPEPVEVSEPGAAKWEPTEAADPSTGLVESPSGWRLRVAVGVFLVVALSGVVFVISKLLG